MKQNKTEALSFRTRNYGSVTVVKSAYSIGGKVAVELIADTGEPIAVLSVNIPESAHLLGSGEFFVKTWSENEELAEDALASGIFRATGRTSKTVLNAPIWASK